MIANLARCGVRGAIAESNWIGATARRKLSHIFLGRDGESWASFYFDNFFSAFSEKDQSELLTEEMAHQFEAGAAYCNVLESWEPSQGELLQTLLYTAITTNLVELLMKQDKLIMAAASEN